MIKDAGHAMLIAQSIEASAIKRQREGWSDINFSIEDGLMITHLLRESITELVEKRESYPCQRYVVENKELLSSGDIQQYLYCCKAGAKKRAAGIVVSPYFVNMQENQVVEYANKEAVKRICGDCPMLRGATYAPASPPDNYIGEAPVSYGEGGRPK